jgi:hypothetical protein
LRGDSAPAGAQKLKSNFELQVRISHCEGSAKVVERRKRVTGRTNPGWAGAALGGSLCYPNGIGLRTLFLAPKGLLSGEHEPRRRRLCRASTGLVTINTKLQANGDRC